jgi:hypothetical protein
MRFLWESKQGENYTNFYQSKDKGEWEKVLNGSCHLSRINPFHGPIRNKIDK